MSFHLLSVSHFIHSFYGCYKNRKKERKTQQSLSLFQSVTLSKSVLSFCNICIKLYFDLSNRCDSLLKTYSNNRHEESEHEVPLKATITMYISLNAIRSMLSWYKFDSNNIEIESIDHFLWLSFVINRIKSLFLCLFPRVFFHFFSYIFHWRE